MTDIILIDDDDIIFFLHKAVLKKAGISQMPLTFNNGSEALNYIKSKDKPGKKFYIFLDINMPEVTGWDVLDSLKKMELQGEPKVIMVTSSVDKSDKDLALSYPYVTHFYSKPLTMDFIQQIRDELNPFS